MSRASDFVSALQLQILAKILREDVTIKESTSETLLHLLATHTREIASLSKKSACSAGRTAVNVSDVLQHVGDLNGLFEFFEQSCVEKRTLVGARTRTTSRKKSRLRPTLASIECAYAAYKPSFLPVLPTQTWDTGRTSSWPKDVELQQLTSKVIIDVYDEMKKREVESSSKKASTTVHHLTIGRGYGLGSEKKQSLRTSIREQGIVVKASGLVSGSSPVLDNS